MAFLRTSIISFIVMCICVSCTSVKKLKTHRTTAETILKTLRIRQKKITSVKGSAKFRVHTKDTKQSSLVNVFMKTPLYARFSFLNFFYQPLCYFVINNSRLYFYPPDLSYVKLATSNEHSVFNMVGVSASPYDIIPIFMGKLPPETLDKAYSLSYSDYEYILKSDMFELRCRVGDFALTSLVKLNIHKEIVFRVTWKNWKQFDKFIFPMLIKISRPVNNRAITCKYRQVLLNKPINKNIFSPSFPEKTIIYNAD